MPVTDFTRATGATEILFEFLDDMIPIQHQPHARMPGEAYRERILQAAIAIREQMQSSPEQFVVKQERQHAAQHLSEAAGAEGEALGTLLDPGHRIGHSRA